MTEEKNNFKENEEVVLDNTKEYSSENSSEDMVKKRKSPKNDKKTDIELQKFIENFKKIEAERDEALDKYKRVLAEYDNFRKRTAKEKEGIYSDAYNDVLKEMLPIVDNLERALEFSESEQIAQGVKLTLSQCLQALEKLGVEVIDAKVGDAFNPDIHNAVMHTESEELGENSIALVIQKGYKRGDRVFRYAMVSVSN